MLATAESIAREQKTIGIAEAFVGKRTRAALLFEMRTREEPAVQERNAAKIPGARRASTNPCVQRAEEQRLENSFLVSSAGVHGPRIRGGEKREIAVEPALRLQKGEEDQSRDVEQSELTSLAPFDATS